MPKKKHRSFIRLGFVPLCDCAPLVMAQELGLFEKHGIEVLLTREVGWATIRDKIIYGELDAAHATAAMPFAATLGLGSIQSDCITGLILNLHGNAITLSTKLRDAGVSDGASLAIEARRAAADGRPLTFGVVFPFSSHNFLLRAWLRSHGIDPERDVTLVVVPPPQMFANLKAGNLDGYCVGEPWNSLAVMKRAGWSPTTSAEIAPLHPEKVLMVRRDFSEECHEEHHALIAALHEACAFCDCPENHERIIETLAMPHFVGAPVQALRMSMTGSFDYGRGRIQAAPDFNIFSRHNANEPTADKAAWVLDHMVRIGLCKGAESSDLPGRVFRADLFHHAINNQHRSIHEKNNYAPEI